MMPILFPLFMLYLNMNRLKELQEEIEKFVKERNWEKYHTPKNLATSVSIEAAELLEHFQWEDKKPREYTEKELQEIGEEISDVFIYLLHLANKLDIDIIDASFEKLEKNRKKYPKELYQGNYKKLNND